jgi:class 3 adenylate cyclase
VRSSGLLPTRWCAATSAATIDSNLATIGDTVNVPSCLEQTTRKLAAEIVASGAFVAVVDAIARPEAEHVLGRFVRYPQPPVHGRNAELEMFVLRHQTLPDPPIRPAPA